MFNFSTPVLFSWTSEMLKTDKSSLAKMLKIEVKMVEPVQTDVEIMDGFYFSYVIRSSKLQIFDKIA